MEGGFRGSSRQKGGGRSVVTMRASVRNRVQKSIGKSQVDASKRVCDRGGKGARDERRPARTLVLARTHSLAEERSRPSLQKEACPGKEKQSS